MIFDKILKNVKIFPNPDLMDIYLKAGRFDQIEPSERKTNYPAQVIQDMKAKTIIPAFTDAHTHFIQWSMGKIQVCLEDAKSYDQALQMINDYLTGHPEASAIIACNFDQYTWKETVLPCKQDLDKISRNCPVVMRRICGHLGVFNSKALQIIENQVDHRFIDFESGIVVEDPVLKIYTYFPPHPQIINKAVMLAQQECFQQGISSVGEITSSLGRKAISMADNQNLLKIKFRLAVNEPDFINLQKGGFYPSSGHDSLSIRAVKIFIDGSIGGKTAAVSFNYSGTPESTKQGILLKSQEELIRLFQSALPDNWKIWIHAIGDRAIDLIISASKKLNSKQLENIRIEHFELPRPEAIKQVADLGIQLCLQPNFINNWSLPGQLYQQVLPEEIYRFNNPLQAIFKQKCNFCFGSDNMPANPIYGIQGTVNSPLNIQNLNLDEAIRRYTYYSAKSLGDGCRGKVISGFEADFAVLNQFPSKSNLSDLSIEQLYINGKSVYNQNGDQ